MGAGACRFSVLFGPTALTDTGMSDEVIAAFTDQCTISLEDLRAAVCAERSDGLVSTWMRYTLQNTPFVRLPNGTFLMLRLQYAVQRMFGELLYLKLHTPSRTRNPPVRRSSRRRRTTSSSTASAWYWPGSPSTKRGSGPLKSSTILP